MASATSSSWPCARWMVRSSLTRQSIDPAT
jgi:hypothetical protein